MSDLWQAVDDRDTLREAGSAFVVATPVAIILIGSAVYILRELRRSPLVIHGRTVEKIERLEAPPPYEDIALAGRLVEGPRWMIDVNRACRLISEPPELYLSPQAIPRQPGMAKQPRRGVVVRLQLCEPRSALADCGLGQRRGDRLTSVRSL